MIEILKTIAFWWFVASIPATAFVLALIATSGDDE